MTDVLLGASERAAELRRAFDRGFAEPVRFDATRKEDLLAIRAGSERYALRMSEIVGMFADRKITPVPGGGAALIGIAGFRGAILPVYRLQTLLNHSSVAPPRWLVIAAARPVALAFEAFEAQLSVPVDAILPGQSHAASRAAARDFVRTAGFTAPILHLPSVLAEIGTPRSETAPREEH